MIALVPIALFGWIPVVLLLFSAFPPRRAVTVAFISGWLFLPYYGYPIPGLPDYSKVSATSLAVLLATFLFCSDWLLALRPRWFDLPMATWCLCPIASSLSNDLGLYDGLSASFDHIVSWGLPYLIGRVYFPRLEHLRELAIGIVVGGLAYVPFCVWELRMSPFTHLSVYGIDTSGFGELVYGGYRPKVFMSCALELGLWMTATSTTGIWLWAGGTLKRIWSISFGWLLIVLLIITILVKVTGALVLLILGVSLWYLTKWSGSRLPAIVLVLVPVIYMTSRTTGLWTGEGAVNLVRTVLNERRAESLGFRMLNEDMLMVKALKQPVFGWGGWNRNGIESEDGRHIAIFDGMWIIALGQNGLVGLISFNLALLLPMLLLIRRHPARVWRAPTMAPAAVLATLVSLYTIDCIANAMLNPIYVLVLGGVTGALGTLGPRNSNNPELHKTFIKNKLYDQICSIDHDEVVLAREQRVGMDPREDAAIKFRLLGRSLMEQGLTHEAEEVWLSALQYWAELAADHPDEPAYRSRWLDCLNDMAWSLITLAGSEIRSLSRAIQLSEQCVGLDPENATYWNTLGTAHLRKGDWGTAIHALERSTELSAGGTSFDYFLLAIAYSKLGDREQAQHWCSLGDRWMKEHNPDHQDLIRFCAEAMSLSGPSGK
jgi:hypothetical protein